MSDTTNSNRDEARHRKEEIDIIRQFWTVVQKRLEEIQRRELKVDDGPNKFQLEDEERKILYEVNNFGLMPGAAAGLSILFLLRRIRPNMLRRIQRPRQPPPQGGVPHVTNSPFQQDSAGGSPYKELQPSLFLRGLGWTLDLMSSFFVAAGTSIVFTDHEVIAQKIATLPLVSGRSRVAQELCPSALDFLRDIRKDESTREVLDAATTTNLQNILAFCRNCRLRADYEERLRREKGVSNEYPVAIPPPGVPVDSSYDSDSLVLGWNEDLTGDFYSQEQSKDNQFDTDDDQRWADSMVSDREDDNRRS